MRKAVRWCGMDGEDEEGCCVAVGWVKRRVVG
jgi:hypothetical protein